MKILLAASEAVPYAKTGGLADVAGALPKALSRLGHEVRVLIPRYNIEKIEASGDRAGFELEVPFADGSTRSAVYVDDSGAVPVFFLDAPRYFHRGRLYGELDDAERFAYFSRAVVEFARMEKPGFDIIHLNDWMTGLVPAYLKTIYPSDDAVRNTKTVFTIHNLAFHGRFGAGLLPKIGLPGWVYRQEAGIEFYGEASSLKAGLVFSDAITTVSPRYSHEIQTAEFGERFDGLLRSRSGDLFGILNGVDYDEWNPETDTHISRNYSTRDLTGKRECKRDLLKLFGLSIDNGEMDRPLIGCISRL
ncbi:MAG TPA: glycogen/starch synthase, partial [Blastocatellia bacterium]|nr:glycogen/starch synthase [Blastocatellia bacterium]